MSTNSKNIIRPEFLKNFTKKIKTRNIVVDKKSSCAQEVTKEMPSISKNVNVLIQDLNLRIHDRQLPYISINTLFDGKVEKRSRFVVHDYETSSSFEKKIKKQVKDSVEISHILDFLIADGFKEVKISSLSCDSELVISRELFGCAVVDILLDIIIFNSYSFLKELPTEEKKMFTRKKFEFFKSNNWNCFYDYADEDNLYYSFAFSARKNEKSIDLKKYIEFWNLFMDKYYPNMKHKEKDVHEQLLQHVDYDELPKNLSQKFDSKPKGAYLLLRTNKDRTENLHPTLCALFGIDEYKKGKIKIVPLKEFNKHKDLFKNLDVSAFKVVKQ